MKNHSHKQSQPLIEYLTTNKEFREQGSMLNGKEYPRTILDNDGEVGRNCLTWMEEVDGMKTRQKIYNKMVQMLESKSVRSDVGSHWKDWVCQKGTRLATARDNARDRGLTRAEGRGQGEGVRPCWSAGQGQGPAGPARDQSPGRSKWKTCDGCGGK